MEKKLEATLTKNGKRVHFVLKNGTDVEITLLSVKFFDKDDKEFGFAKILKFGDFDFEQFDGVLKPGEDDIYYFNLSEDFDVHKLEVNYEQNGEELDVILTVD